MQDFISHIRDFGIYLYKEKLKDFKQEKWHDQFTSFKIILTAKWRMEWNGSKKKKSRATAIVMINAHFGVSLCKGIYTPLIHTDVKISPCSP